MQQRKSVQKGKMSYTMGALIGIMTAIIISLLLSAMLTVLISNENIQIHNITHLIPLVIFVSAAAGSLLSIKLCNDRFVIIAGLVAVAYLFVLVGFGVLLFDGGFHNLWMNLLSVTCGCVLSCTICIIGERRSTKRKRAYR